MNLTNGTIIRRTLRYHGRSSLAVALGVAAATAALAGALFVGDSMRAGLRAWAIARLGPVEAALAGGGYYRESLAAELQSRTAPAAEALRLCPIITGRASVEHAERRTRANRIQLLGVDARFWSLFEAPPPAVETHRTDRSNSSDRVVRINRRLADALEARVGDDVLIRLEARSDVPMETLLGRRDESVATLRLTIFEIVPNDDAGAFALNPGLAVPLSAFVPLAVLQRALKSPDRVNTILVSTAAAENREAPHREESRKTGLPFGEQAPGDASIAVTPASALNAAFPHCIRLEDLDVRVRRDEPRRFLAVESPRLLIAPAVERAALTAAASTGLTAVPILTYLANSISLPDGRNVPYSTVAALDLSIAPPGVIPLADGRSPAALQPGDIILNEWAAADLSAKIGDTVTLAYFITLPGGALEERSASFTLRGVARIADWAADPSLTPNYEGITDAKRISDWDPPFPVDMKRIRPRDEDYWDRHKALPKAFISLADGRRLWAESGARFGTYTSIRILVPSDRAIDDAERQWTGQFLTAISPRESGLAFEPVRDQALAASAGSTDFGGLFIGFSSFLIIAAALLVALLFRLGVERRSKELGAMLALGLSARRVRQILLGEGLVLVIIGAGLGIALATGYAQLMLDLLQRQWPDSLGAPVLTVAVTWPSAVIGWACSAGIGLLSIAWSVRAMTRRSAQTLLSGGVSDSRRTRSPRAEKTWRAATILLILAAMGLAIAPLISPAVSPAVVFFALGFLLLTILLISLWRRLAVRHVSARDPSALAAEMRSVAWLSLRNARRQPSRSLLSAGLVACATFVIVAVGANRHTPDEDTGAVHGPTGGYRLMAESVTPLPYDLATPSGRTSLGIAPDTSTMVGQAGRPKGDAAAVAAFRLRPGDDASCLNLYQVRTPRILGARPSFIARPGFTFSATLADSDEERRNPWQLLHRVFPDGAVPAIGDESSVRWLLHLGLGDDFVIHDERGREVRLRIVAMLSGSMLQGEIVIAESNFMNLFPSISGYGFFLINAPAENAAFLASALERDLARFGMDVEPTLRRLASYRAIENVYLSTFQWLGGLGLILGTIGLAAVMLRNIWERRGELALLRAIGLNQRRIRRMCIGELAALLLCGLAVGTMSAALAVAPYAWSHVGAIPWGQLAATLASVLIVGVLSGAAAIHSSLRTPLVSALRRE